MELLRFHGWMGEINKGVVLKKVLKNASAVIEAVISNYTVCRHFFQHFECGTRYPFSNTTIRESDYVRTSAVSFIII